MRFSCDNSTDCSDSVVVLQQIVSTMTKWISVTAAIILYVITCDATFTWTSVPLTKIGTSDLQSGGTIHYQIPDVIPDAAKEVFIHVAAFQGNTYLDRELNDFLKIYTVNGYNTYEQYLYLYGYPQDAVNTNSDNMWFPMSSNRSIYLEVPVVNGPHCWVGLYAIGYY